MTHDRDHIEQDQSTFSATESSEDSHESSAGHHRGGLTRRLFLKGSGATAALGGIAALPAARTVAQDSMATPAATPSSGMAGMYGDPSDSNAPVAFFSMLEATTIEALTARIMPGTPDDPGAREAGVVYYIDRQLSGANLGQTLKTYTQGPFLSTVASGGSVSATSQTNLYQYVYVQDENVPRYGYQSVLAPQDLYRRALLAVNAYAKATFKKNVAELTADQQDQIVTALQNGKATGFDSPTPQEFFTQLRNDTIEGMFSDPMYGGNRGLAGWKLIGYPGAQRFYTANDMKNTSFKRNPQSLGQMMASENS